MSTHIKCPVCDQQDLVEKVSTIYLIGIGLTGNAASQTSPVDQHGPGSKLFQELSESELRVLSRRLSPPSSKKEVLMRPLHPDLVVLTFSLVVPIFLFGMIQNQPALLLPGLIILGFSYLLYAWKRKFLLKRFDLTQHQRLASQERIQYGIDRWMKLYNCARDDGVFEPGSHQLVPADEMMSALIEKQPSQAK